MTHQRIKNENGYAHHDCALQSGIVKTPKKLVNDLSQEPLVESPTEAVDASSQHADANSQELKELRSQLQQLQFAEIQLMKDQNSTLDAKVKELEAAKAARTPKKTPTKAESPPRGRAPLPIELRSQSAAEVAASVAPQAAPPQAAPQTASRHMKQTDPDPKSAAAVTRKLVGTWESIAATMYEEARTPTPRTAAQRVTATMEEKDYTLPRRELARSTLMQEMQQQREDGPPASLAAASVRMS